MIQNYVWTMFVFSLQLTHATSVMIQALTQDM